MFLPLTTNNGCYPLSRGRLSSKSRRAKSPFRHSNTSINTSTKDAKDTNPRGYMDPRAKSGIMKAVMPPEKKLVTSTYFTPSPAVKRLMAQNDGRSPPTLKQSGWRGDLSVTGGGGSVEETMEHLQHSLPDDSALSDIRAMLTTSQLAPSSSLRNGSGNGNADRGSRFKAGPPTLSLPSTPSSSTTKAQLQRSGEGSYAHSASQKLLRPNVFRQAASSSQPESAGEDDQDYPEWVRERLTPNRISSQTMTLIAPGVSVQSTAKKLGASQLALSK